MFSDKNMVAITNLKCQTPNVRSNSSFLPFSKRWIWLRNAEEESNPGGLYLLLIAGVSIPECEQILIPSFFVSFDLVLPGGRGRGYIGNRKHWLTSPAYKIVNIICYCCSTKFSSVSVEHRLLFFYTVYMELYL